MLPFTATARELRADIEADVIWVGEKEGCSSERRKHIAAEEIRVVAFEDVTEALISALRPELVYSALFGDDFDGTELAIRLEEIGFRGCYTAIAEDIPHPEVILRDVRMAAPTLHFDLIVTSAIPRRLN